MTGQCAWPSVVVIRRTRRAPSARTPNKASATTRPAAAAIRMSTALFEIQLPASAAIAPVFSLRLRAASLTPSDVLLMGGALAARYRRVQASVGDQAASASVDLRVS